MRYDDSGPDGGGLRGARTQDAREADFAARRRRRTRRRVLAGAAAAIFCAWCLFFSVDYARAQRGRTPVFSLAAAAEEYAQLRITEYYGLFYKIIDYDFGAGRSVLEVGTCFLRPNIPILPDRP